MTESFLSILIPIVHFIMLDIVKKRQRLANATKLDRASVIHSIHQNGDSAPSTDGLETA